MSKKFTYEDVKEQLKQYGFELLDTEYKNNQTNMAFKNEDGYIGYARLANIKMGKSPRYFSKYNPYSIDNIKLYLLKRNSDTMLLSEKFVDSESPLLFRCECGEIFECSWLGLSGRSYTTCPKCAIVSRGKNRRVSFDKVINDYKDAGLTLLASSEEYCGNSTRLLCQDKDGYLGYMSLNKAQHNCNLVKFSTSYNSKENVIYNINLYAKMHSITAVCLDLCDEDRWTRQGILCRCECGNTFTTSISSFMNGKDRCDICTKRTSRIEFLAEQWLKDNGIDYIKQYRFDDCKNVISLPFDFYIPFKNILIEIDGEGHYGLAYFHNCSYEKALESYERIVLTDSIKNEYCKNNNIKLLRIPYWEFVDTTYQNTLYTNLIKE